MMAAIRTADGQAGPEATGDPKPISRRWAAIAFIVSSLVTAALSVSGGWLSHHYEQQQDTRQKDFKSFREVAGKFDRLFRDFVPAYLATASVDAQGRTRTAQRLDGQVVRSRVDAIQSNILQQDDLLERLEMVTAGRDVGAVRDYRRQLVALSSSLDHLPPVEDSPPLMRELERARASRNTVLRALQTRADSLFYNPPSANGNSAAADARGE